MKKNQFVSVLVKGERVTGKIAAIRDVEGNGQWIDVCINPDAKPKERVTKAFRLKAVTLA